MNQEGSVIFNLNLYLYTVSSCNKYCRNEKKEYFCSAYCKQFKVAPGTNKGKKMKRGFISLAAEIVSKRVVGSCLLLMWCVITVSAQVKISFNPDSGGKYEYVSEIVQNIKQNFMGQDMPMKTEINATYLMEIKSKTSQEIETQMTYQRFIFIISNPMMNVKYDSKAPDDNSSDINKMFQKMFNTMIDKPFTVVFLPNGSVKSVSGMGEIVENMLNAISADGQLAVLGSQMSQQFNDEAMQKSLGQSFNLYPDKAIKVGDTWSTENSLPMNYVNVSVKTTNTLKAVNANKATIDVTGEMDMDMEESKMKGAQTGTMIIDTSTGLPLSSDILLDMKGVVKTQGMEIKMEIESKAKMSVKKIN